jgi:WD40 repeat protein/uncharacterized caspase-like protein
MNRRQAGLGVLRVVAWAILAGSAVAQDVKPLARKPQVWAIIVGIDNYVDPLIPDSRVAVRDATEIRSWFLGPGGWGRDDVLFLADLGSRQPGPVEAPRASILPIQENLNWAFQRWLPAHAMSGDLVVIYYSGRAGTVVAQPGAAREPRLDYYLLPSDANSANLPFTGWSLDRAVDRLVRDTSGRCAIVCWLATTVGGGPPGIRPPVPAALGGRPQATATGRDWLSRLARWPGVTAWLASDRPLENVVLDEPSTPFTRTLVRGLGDASHKQNLAATLLALRGDAALRRQGFQTVGGVPPRMTLWADRFGLPAIVARPEMVLQVGHGDRVTAIVTSPDGQQVITASRDSTVRVWSLKDKALLRVLTGHEVGTTALGWSHDGRWLVSGGGRPANAIMIHDLTQDFHAIAFDRAHESGVERIAVLPDGAHCISIDLGAHAVLWNLKEPPPESQPWPDQHAANGAKAADRIACLDVACGGDAQHGVVAALCEDKTVRIYHASGSGEPTLKRWPDQPTAIAVDPESRWLAVGFEDGRVVMNELATGEETTRRISSGPIGRLNFSSARRLAVSHARGVSLVPIVAADTEQPSVLIDQPAEVLAFSLDGRFLAACAKNHGGLLVWDVSEVEPKLVLRDDDAGVSTLAFTVDSRVLISGGFKGAIKTWSLASKDDHSWSIPANRARVEWLSASPGRRFLLLLNELNQAQIWDLKERTCRQLPGAWTSAAFAGDDRLVLTEAPGPGRPGRLVNARLDEEGFSFDASFFKRSEGEFEVPEGVAFALVAIAGNGSRVAAAAHRAQVPLVCVWDAKTGRLTHWFSQTGLTAAVQCLSFSTDGRYLLTAGDSPEARLWDLANAKGEARTAAVTFRDRDGAHHITAAQIDPADPHQVVTGHSDGRVCLRKWRDGQPAKAGPSVDVVLGLFAGKAKALSFSSDGKNEYLAASGDGTSLWIGTMVQSRPQTLKNLGARPHHLEQVNALIAWPPATAVAARAATLISGSDDATVKFWEITDNALRLRATFATTSARPAAETRPDPGAPAEVDWVVYTPEGQFDASARGRPLVRLRHTEQARGLEQFDETKHFSFDLGERLLARRPTDTVANLAEPPPITIEPPTLLEPGKPDTELTVILGSRDQKDIRLYHNNVPIKTGLESIEAAAPATSLGRITVPVRLVKGINEFYAMATTTGRDGSFDSKSPEIRISYDGPSDPGQLHVIALGVGDYKRRRLQFADRDAELISGALHDRSAKIAGVPPGMRIVLPNGEATPEGVNKAFREVAERVKDRPQDTVVVFLAGHTGVFEAVQFCLLLPSFPFPAEEPPATQERSAVVAREGKIGKADPKDVLPYALIEANLMRLDALNRLVIVDACQAEAILEDAQVREIRKWMEIRSRRARTFYLMAARRGEPALEVEGLRHGLFTYTLLRGMGADEMDRAQEPSEVSALHLPDNADFDNDGIITTGELERYARSTLPQLARLFPLLVTRNREHEAKARPNLPRIPAIALEQELRMQSSNVSFPLVQLPKRVK